MKLDYLKVHSVIKESKRLTKIYNWYLRNCTTLTNPYHNMRHTLGMMYHVILCYERSQTRNYGFVLTKLDLQELLVSALFHDFNHSAGRFNDEVNIKIAKRGLKNCLEELSLLEGEFYFRCSKNIDATQFPYIIKDLTVNQRILRECDLLVAFYDDYLTQNILGLAEEMKAKDIVTSFENNNKFIENSISTLELTYSKEIIEENTKEFYQFIKIFSEIIK